MLTGEVGVVAVRCDLGRAESEHLAPELTVSPCGDESLGKDLRNQ